MAQTWSRHQRAAPGWSGQRGAVPFQADAPGAALPFGMVNEGPEW